MRYYVFLQVAEVVNVEPEKVVSSTTFSVPVESVEVRIE